MAEPKTAVLPITPWVKPKCFQLLRNGCKFNTLSTLSQSIEQKKSSFAAIIFGKLDFADHFQVIQPDHLTVCQ